MVSAVPAVLVTILIFMDQQITAVILNRREYKLQVSGRQGTGRTQPTGRTQVSAGPRGPGGQPGQHPEPASKVATDTPLMLPGR